MDIKYVCLFCFKAGVQLMEQELRITKLLKHVHTYPLFKAGHVQSIVVSHKGNQYFIKCTCLPEMKKDLVYNLEMTLDGNRDIVAAVQLVVNPMVVANILLHFATFWNPTAELLKKLEKILVHLVGKYGISLVSVAYHHKKLRKLHLLKEEYGKSKCPLQPMV